MNLYCKLRHDISHKKKDFEEQNQHLFYEVTMFIGYSYNFC